MSRQKSLVRQRRRGVWSAVCVVLALLIARPADGARQGWKLKSFKATICAGGKPFWGKPRGFGCQLLSATVSGQVAYNGKQVWGQWIDCQKDSAGVRNDVKWCHYWNNGGRAPHGYMSLGMNGEVDGSVGPFGNISTYWVRIDVRPNGTAKLRGGTNRD